MRLFIILIILLFNLINYIYAEDNIFNNYLLHNETFKLNYTDTNTLSILNNNLIQSNITIKFDKSKRSPLQNNDKLKKFFDIKSKTISPDINISLNKSTNLSFGYKNENSEFTPVSEKRELFHRDAYNLNIQQLWGYNIASRFSYLYRKNYFQKLNNFNFSEKKYSFNITKFFNNNRFDFLYQYTEADSSDNNENIYMLQDDKYQKISFSYEISFSKKFSLVLLYSLNESSNEDSLNNSNYLYTGFKYIFNDLK